MCVRKSCIQHPIRTFQEDKRTLAVNSRHGQEFWLLHTHHEKQKQNVSFCVRMPLRNGESKRFILVSLPLWGEMSVFRLYVVCSLFMAIIFLRFSSIVACCALCLFSGCSATNTIFPFYHHHIIDFLAQLLHFSVNCPFSNAVFLTAFSWFFVS